jgi:transcriptional regulator with XRE-family HTH domain
LCDIHTVGDVQAWAEVGQRVRQARLAAGLSQADLAAVLGVDRSALARVESGDRHLSALELFSLADHLRLPLGHFVSTSPVAVASHRQDLSEDADDVARATYRLDALLEAHARDAQWLRDGGYLSASNIVLPDPSSQRAPAATADDARLLAGAVRRALGIAGPIDAMADALALAGLFLLVVPDLSGGGSLSLGAGFGVAIVGGKDEPGRRRMTAAHELGHFVLQDEYRTDIGVSASRDEREQRIEAFAAEFLLPSEAMTQSWARVDGAERRRLIQIAVDYRVSWSVAVSAASRLDLLGEEGARRVLGARPTRGELIEVAGSVPREDLRPGETAGVWSQAAIAAWRSGTITDSRVVELVHGAITETDLPEVDDAS